MLVTDERTDGLLNEQKDRWKDRRKDGQTAEWPEGWTERQTEGRTELKQYTALFFEAEVK